MGNDGRIAEFQRARPTGAPGRPDLHRRGKGKEEVSVPCLRLGLCILAAGANPCLAAWTGEELSFYLQLLCNISWLKLLLYIQRANSIWDAGFLIVEPHSSYCDVDMYMRTRTTIHTLMLGQEANQKMKICSLNFVGDC